MRIALPLVLLAALLAMVVLALIFISQDAEHVPDITVTDSGPAAGTSQKRNNESGAGSSDSMFGVSDSRVCSSQPVFIDVTRVADETSSESSETIAGVAQFRVNDVLAEYASSNNTPADSLRVITLVTNVAAEQSDSLLEFNLAGSVATPTVIDSTQVVLRFPGHLLRNHSVVTLMVRDDTGQLQDLADYSNWLLCGEPFDDPQYSERKPVANNVSDLTLGPGVNVMGGEYACVQGWGLHHHVSVGVTHTELADMLLQWGVKTVRLPLNEHCWLAERYPFGYLNQQTSGSAYRESVQQLVELLTGQFQMHVVLDLHWTGTIAEKAMELKPLPNHEFSAAFWTDVAQQFAHNEKVVFNLFNESHVPGPPPAGDESVAEPAVDAVDGNDKNDEQSLNRDLSAGSELEQTSAMDNWWLIWRDGNEQYAGMQSLVDAIRATDARNHISVGGLDYSADQRGWVSYAPHDPLGKLWVDNHAYPAGNKCNDQLCWEQTLLPLVANGYGVMFGEAGNSIGQHPQGCQTDFVKRVYRFARDNAIPAIAWTFIAGGVADTRTNQPTDNNCQIPTLLTRWPGESADGDLSQNEVADKKTYDPTPDNMLDDATWAGCAFYAYANGLPLDDINLPDVDPAEADPARNNALENLAPGNLAPGNLAPGNPAPGNLAPGNPARRNYGACVAD